MNERDRIEFRDRLVEMAKKTLLFNIETKGEMNYVDEKMMEPDDFALEVKVVKFAEIEKYLKVHVGANEMFEEDIKDNRIIFKYPLNFINYIKVKHRKEFHKVNFCSSHGFSYKLKLNPYEADYLILGILHAIQIKEDTDLSTPLVFIEPIDLGIRIHGRTPDMDSSLFEIPLKKELEETLKDKDIHNQKLRKLILNAAMNMTFTGMEYDGRFVQTLFEFLAKYTEIIKKLEVDSYDQYLNYNKKNPENKEVFEIYQGISITLSLLKNCLYWRTTLPDISTFKRQIEILLALSSSKNSAISIMSSFTLRSLLKVI
jgi:hypothetical protein